MPEIDDFVRLRLTSERINKLRLLSVDLKNAFLWYATMDGAAFWFDACVRLNEIADGAEEWLKEHPNE